MKEYWLSRIVSGKTGDEFEIQNLIYNLIPEAIYSENSFKALTLCERLRDLVVTKDLGKFFLCQYHHYKASIHFLSGDFENAAKSYEYLCEIVTI